MDVAHLEKRHGTAINVEVANLFVFAFLCMLSVYSIYELLSSRYQWVPRYKYRLTSPIVLSIVWMIMVLGGIFYHYNANIIQLARRLGQLAIGMSTISIILAFKPAIFPRTYQANLVPIHKWIGRTGIVCAMLHGSIYFISYVLRAKSDGSHDKRHEGEVHKLFSLFNVFGMISFLALVVILGTSLRPVRRSAYYVFYALHRPLVTLIYILMIWHARPKSWLLVPLGLLLIASQAIVRFVTNRNVEITKVQRFGDSLLLVSFEPPVPESLIRSPASHVRLGPLLSSPTVLLKPSHPYTLIGVNKLILREGRFKLTEGNRYSLGGPFSSSFKSQPYTHLLVFAGGSGVSMFPSINGLVVNQKFVWITRSAKEMPILDELQLENCEVYITNSMRSNKPYSEEADDFELEQFEIDSVDDEEVIPSGSEEAGAPESVSKQTPPSPSNHVRYTGRPNFSKVADDFLSGASNYKLCVVACGPENLVNAVTKWANLNNYDLWSEVYAF